MIPIKEHNPNGLHRRYSVVKIQGPTDPKAVYFVLRLDSKGSDAAHIEACRAAAKAYADKILSCEEKSVDHLRQIARDLRKLIYELELE